MLNRAARYFPILRELRRHSQRNMSVLDVGSGPVGIGEFWPHPFVGCDVDFAVKPRNPMRAVICSGARLPFGDGSFDAVVASDVMEHVPPEKRRELIFEVLRVARRIAVFGFPCGPAALEFDKNLRKEYVSRKRTPPIWLEEHMLYPFPSEDLFRNTPNGWEVRVIPNESLQFHFWMMRTEMNRLMDYLFKFALVVVPAAVELVLRRADTEPCYRKLFVLRRRED